MEGSRVDREYIVGYIGDCTCSFTWLIGHEITTSWGNIDCTVIQLSSHIKIKHSQYT